MPKPSALQVGYNLHMLSISDVLFRLQIKSALKAMVSTIEAKFCTFPHACKNKGNGGQMSESFFVPHLAVTDRPILLTGRC